MERTNLSFWNLLFPISQLCKINQLYATKLQRFLPKQIWTQSDRDEILNILSEFLLNGECVVDLCVCFGPLVLELASRLTSSILREGHSGHRLIKKLAVSISRGFCISHELQRYAADFVRLYKPFSLSDTLSSEEPTKKKAKKNQMPDLDWCCGVWNYLEYLPEVVSKIDMSSLYDYLSSTDIVVRWYAALAISRYLSMSENETQLFLKKYFTPEEHRSLLLRMESEKQKIQEKVLSLSGTVYVNELLTDQTHTRQSMITGDLSPDVVDVMGILLPRLNSALEEKDLNSLVLVPSTKQHLRSLALAVSCHKPVMLQGPVGCGKTTLVEYLGKLTGRHKVPELLKIQLGDQTDNKALLGTYCSTEIPGEFVWRAGVLTQAILAGSWVLLEDVDTAPMDVLSLLVALAETGSLSVPGHGDEVRASPGFQLFTTQRLHSSSGGLHHQRAGSCVVLEKLCAVINVEPLSRDELKEVISVKYPALSPVVDKLLNIYFMLSAGKHNMGDAEETEELSTHGKFLSLDGRLISTRDLMTWCSRSSIDFDHKVSTQGLKVFLEALDCFVSCLSKPSMRLSLASAIGVKLNLTEDRSKYFCTEHKPTLRETQDSLEVGRAKLTKKKLPLASFSSKPAPTFSYTRASVILLEKVSVCVQRNEPVLLCGETGTGKTSTVQFLAHYLGHKLHVINLNQQSDSTDLLGGFKPVDLKFVIMPVREEFETLFCQAFSRVQNEKFLSHIQALFLKKSWSDLLTLMEAPIQKALNKFNTDLEQQEKWIKVKHRISELRKQIRDAENVLAFSFIEGTLVRALRNGDWVLLDEINLATAETLECLSGLLESVSGSIVLTERGDIKPITRHPDFRLFACMNPATDVGKKDLSVGIRNRFTEFFVEELECSKDLSTLVRDYLPGLSLSSKQVSGIVSFYLSIKNDPSEKLTDGTGHKPHYSLRTLCRALRYCARNPCKSVPRSLYEGFSLSFLTQLDRSSHPLVCDLICKHLLHNTGSKAILGQKLPKPEKEADFIQVADYWISKGQLNPSTPADYIVTPSVKLNLKDLARVVSAGKHPVLIQGETSVGKTSLITYLAQLTGNVCVRVNNHEHTDLQEYIGCYAADEHGKLVFKEGVLVDAMRKGHWIILDELNLAPTDVLEALNRLLDDNQELYIPETQEMVQAHPKFILFATQNPPGLYGGRKILSRAFRNRFIELHFDEIPPSELETILHERCGIPLSYAKKLVVVMLELQTRRRGSGIFSGKHGFMTLRDLFRWALRYNCSEAGRGEKFYDWDQHLVEHGYMLLAGRVRKPEEEVIIVEVLEKHFKRKLSTEALFNLTPQTSAPIKTLLNSVMNQGMPEFQHVVWTYNMRRLAVLIGQAIRFKEPVLLVGDTGVGKTTVCQLYAAMQGKTFYSINCHMHTESADFLGGLRPVRSHEDEKTDDHRLFEWKDGPLVLAMKEGAMFLIDEISLADDSVLERLNSVLEPERTILLAEKGSGGEMGTVSDVEVLKASDDFHVFATMNPGGDFGKKELSPALRNRFTEIWCPQSHDAADLISVIEKNIKAGLQLFPTTDGSSGFGRAIVDFIQWFFTTEMGKRATVSIRDILSWIRFINICSCDWKNEPDAVSMETNSSSLCTLDPLTSYIHGACLIFIDSLGTGSTTFSSESNTQTSRLMCIDFLCKQLSKFKGQNIDITHCGLLLNRSVIGSSSVIITDQLLTIPPFSIRREPVEEFIGEKFSFDAPTTCINAQRLLRGLQLPRPILLEGSPGVGKTSLVAAVARMARKKLIRINLSEQTDVTDLFGADLPVEGSEGGVFAWRDGPFLQALKAGHWVVFDELNLASQSVLEGLNACFDHRAEVYIPELGKTFHIEHEKTRIFACQNPLSQGGGRKGLPRSFLNRFTQVYVDPFTRDDLIFISTTMYPNLPADLLTAMVDFNSKMFEETMVKKLWGVKGSPWEFNLRDLFRWCDLLMDNQTSENLNPGEYVGLIYRDRMRSVADKSKVEELYMSTVEAQYPLYKTSRKMNISSSTLQVGHSFLPRFGHALCHTASSSTVLPLHHSMEPLESLMKCVQMGWLAILLGPQSSGKTSLVKLLAELTNHPLIILPMNSSMDTTELLGGFEQSDMWRHLGEIVALVASEVKRVERQCLIDVSLAESSKYSSLERDWASYHDLNVSNEGMSSEDVISLLLQHIKHLQTVAIHLDKVDPSGAENRLSVNHKLAKLLATVSSMKPGTGGGAFEWVDSVLVKALQNGFWLLIDNVNFCSASVLDRLNALMEPNGVLSINERGTIDGEIMTIIPHPNFRLFFAMDPKRGEISRAMRNRGIEIYILGEDDGYTYSDRDIKAMLNETGLSNRQLCDWLLAAHSSFKSELPYSERPVFADLFHAGAMCAQLLKKGFELKEAVSHVMEDVYVSSKKNITTKKFAKELALKQLLELPQLGREASPESSLTPLLPSLAGEPSQLVNIKLAAKALVTLLEKLSEKSENLSETQVVELQTATSIYISLQPESSWKLAIEWFNHLMLRVLSKPSPGGDAEYKTQVESLLYGLKSVLSTSLNHIFDSLIWKDVKMKLGEIFKASNTALALLEDQPWDLNTNPQACQHAAYLLCQSTGQTLPTAEAGALAHLQQLVHRLEMVQYSIVLSSNLKDKVMNLQKSMSAGKKKPSPQLLGLVSIFLSEVTELLPQLIGSLGENIFLDLYKTPFNLLWLVRLADTTLSWPDIHKDIYTAHLALHWQWTGEKLSFLTEGNHNENPKLDMVVQELKRHLGGGDHSAKQFSKFWSSFGHPKPFVDRKEAELCMLLNKVVWALNLNQTDSLEVLQKKVRVLTASAVTSQVWEIITSVEQGDLTHVEAALQVVVSVLSQSGISLQTGAKQNSEPVQRTITLADQADRIKPFKFVTLWPLFEHMSLLTQFTLDVKSLMGAQISSDCLQLVSKSSTAACMGYVLSHTPNVVTPSSHCGILSRLWESQISRNYHTWLAWPVDEEFALREEILGPAMLHHSPMSRFAMQVLSSGSNTDLLPLHVTLGGLEEQTQQVALVSRHVWCHCATLASQEFDPRYLEQQLLWHAFIKLVRTLETLLPESTQPDWSEVVMKLQTSDDNKPLVLEHLLQLLNSGGHNLSAEVTREIHHCVGSVRDVLGLTENPSAVGRGLVSVGIVLVHLLSPKGPVDPIEKACLKLKHFTQENKAIEAELKVWNIHLEASTGVGISATPTEHLHPRVVTLLQRQDSLKAKIVKLEKFSAYRPDQMQYTQLCQAINRFLENTCSAHKVSDLLNKMNLVLSREESDAQVTGCLREERVWQDTTSRFISQLQHTFECYRDIVVPFVNALYKVKLGLRLLAVNVEHALNKHKVWCTKKVESVVKTLCTFPSVNQSLPDLLTLANHLAIMTSYDSIPTTLQLASKDPSSAKNHTQGVKSRLLVCALLLMKAHSYCTRQIDGSLISTISHILGLFAAAWAEQEERRRQKEEEEAALYKYKDQIHGDERSEKEKDEADFQAAYPSFAKDFIDVTGADRLEDVGLEATHETGVKQTSLEGISLAEMVQVCAAHNDILTTMSTADWLEKVPCDGSVISDVLTSSLMSYQVGAEVVKSSFTTLSPDIDKSILGSHLLVGGSVLQYLDTQSSSPVSHTLLQKSYAKTYNIYYDANVPEVIKCKPVIDSLRRRVEELQKEWPDHPTLLLLNQIMDRILTFSVTSPVIKFLTGLELLLQKAQDWESNAASFVSMSTQLSEITAVIVEWRKLELSCWSSSLDREEEKCKEKASHWWFHLYQIVSGSLAEASDSSANTASTLEFDTQTSLKKFMESSPIGEYSVRLQMLLAFHCQVLHTDKSPAQKKLLHMLWNVYQFYKQYQSNIEDEIKRLRSPIDKQLKGFVKIARWSDMNYWALKTSTEKTHRTVHKYIKEYQHILNQPVKSILGDRGDDLVSLTVKQTLGFSLPDKLDGFTKYLCQQLTSHSAPSTVTFVASPDMTKDLPLLQRIPTLCRKMKNHLMKCIADSHHAKNVLVFDGFTGELIQEMHELQALHVDMASDKEKQKTEARSINLRKRKGLSELYKYLTLIGLSYRKGVTGKKTALPDALELPPLNLNAHPLLPVTTLWSGCENYFYRCISRHAQFSSAIVSPSKELSMSDVERCRGFIEHFSQLYVQQRARLTEFTSCFLTLRKLLQSLKTLEELSSYNLPPQDECHIWLDKVKQLTTKLFEGLTEFSLLLELCPSPHQNHSLASVYPSPLTEDRLTPSSLWCRGDPEWTQYYGLTQKMLQEIKDEQSSIDHLLSKAVLGRSDMDSISRTLDVYTSFTQQFELVTSQFSDQSGTSSCLVSTLAFLTCEISTIKQEFSPWLAALSPVPPEVQSVQAQPDLTQVTGLSLRSGKILPPSHTATEVTAAPCGDKSKLFLKDVESFVEVVLLSVQTVVKMKEEETKKAPTTKEDDTDSEELKESHLTKHVLDIEKNTMDKLNSPKVVNKLEELIAHLSTLSSVKTPSQSESCENIPLCVRSLLQTKPLVLAFSSLVESQLGNSVAIHRSMGKLLSVLLAVFAEMAQKGFCIPPELSEEVDGEGATEFKDIEGGGIGEGQGAKDVSDQIESEDQLEEAKRPGQEEKPEESQDQPDIPSEDNAIEMSDDFDGKLHDMDGDEKDEEEDDNEKEEEDMDKQIGDADGEDNDRLDDRMWGSDDEEEPEEKKDTEEDQGKGGMDKEKEEMVAKDDSKSFDEDNDNNQQQQKDDNKENDLPMEDDENYDDNQVNPHNTEEEKEAENLDIPDDLNLDDGEKNDKEEDMETDNMEDNQDDDEGKTTEETEEPESKETEDNVEEINAQDEKQQGDNDGGDAEEAEDEQKVDHLQAEEEKEKADEGEGTDGETAPDEEKPTSELNRNREENKSEDKVDTVEDSKEPSTQSEASDSKQGGVEQEEVTDKQDENNENEGVGASNAEDQEGHIGQQSNQSTDSPFQQQQQKKHQRNPGKSDSDRSLGSHDKDHSHLKTKENSIKKRQEADEDNEEEDRRDRNPATEYEHVKDAKSHYDAQTVDVATKDQMLEKQAVPTQEEEDKNELKDDDDVKMDEEMEEDTENMDAPKLSEKKKTKSKEMTEEDKESESGGNLERQKVEIDGERVVTMTAERRPDSTIHTVLENLHLGLMPQDMDVDALRTELEQCVQVWSHPEDMPADVIQSATEAWQKYQTITGPLSQELCEQLRLILEPSQATKLKGDYRTGKRLNMRKVIPYIASQFRKDKIWLRRSKPSKRQYQIMLAVDDSASMADNHSKQLAFESLALVSNALTLLESGELAVCSFGEEVRLLHPFSQPFTNQSGARILQQLSCEQKQTKYGMLLDQAMALLLDARSHQTGAPGNSDTAQLLLVLSDGHGVFREGMDFVRRAVRRARAARIFLVFVIMDNPQKKGSILDARVPIMDSSGKIQEIKSYMELFPFPFYIILRDISMMPQILSDALRQWFELVTGSDR
ncbi:midasin-like [Physella acuta]|uniref:midasin-like n=1 Tax=Physella acuta TaxID=109671 RepID=UPI0027DCD485|nr:midasin-like [Physella acuta]